MKRLFALAEVKSVDGSASTGEFEAMLSAETLDRDGEVIKAGAFNPLPDSIPIHAFHDFHDPVGRAVPYYDGDVLKARGIFASTPRAQEIRTLVTEGVIGHMSVGFMAAVREFGDAGPVMITSGELLEASFVSVPSNRQAAILMAKSYEEAAHNLPASAEDTDAPATPADPAGKSLASEVVEGQARVRVDAFLLSHDL